MESSGDVNGLYFEFSLLVLVVLIGLEKVKEGLIVCRSRSYDNLEVVPALADPLYETKENIVVDGSLVDIVQNDH